MGAHFQCNTKNGEPLKCIAGGATFSDSEIVCADATVANTHVKPLTQVLKSD